MTQAVDPARNLSRLLRRLGKPRWPEVPDTSDSVAVMVFSFLTWEASVARALTAYRRVREAVVDLNDLRVCLPHETVGVIGERYPAAQERCQRIRASLNDLYLREHKVTLEHAREMGKRDVKRYIDSLEGMVPYVSSRVCLLCFDVHAMPVDESLRRALIDEEMVEPTTGAEEISGWLTRHVGASEAVEAHWSLQLWSDRRSGSGRAAKSGARTPGGAKKSATRDPAASRGGGAKKTRKRAGRAASAP